MDRFSIVTFAVLLCAAPLSPAELVSVNSAGTNGGNDFSEIDEDDLCTMGHVLFASYSTDLTVHSDTNSELDLFVRNLETEVTSLVSISITGDAGGATESDGRITPDGRYVLYTTDFANHVAVDTNNDPDVFVRDLQKLTTTLVTQNLAGTDSGNDSSFSYAITPDGRFATFWSRATDLVADNDTNLTGDIFVRDLDDESTTLVSFNSSGTDTGAGESSGSFISDGGRYVLFTSDADDLVGNDANATTDVFLRDLEAPGSTTLISVNTSGFSGNSWSQPLFFSPDGRYVLFESMATDLVDEIDNNGSLDLFLRDLGDNSTTLISIDVTGTSTGNGGFQSGRTLFKGGRLAFFRSVSTDLVAGDNNGFSDLFVRDIVLDETTLLSMNQAGTNSAGGNTRDPTTTDSTRFVVFTNDATDLTSGNDTNGAQDIFVRDRLMGRTEVVSGNSTGTNTGAGASTSPLFSHDASRVFFQSRAEDLDPLDSNGKRDVFDAQNPMARSVDFGDAGLFGYPTRFADDGASHEIDMSLFLGVAIDGEPDGLPSDAADGDDQDGTADEDGVELPALFVRAETPRVTVSASTAGILNAWIDWNADGDWDDVSEQVLTDVGVVAGAVSLQVTVPPTALFNTSFARFRLDSSGGLAPTGHAEDGEVEDYPVLGELIFSEGFESGDTSAWSRTVPN